MVWMVNITNLWVIICIPNKEFINTKEFIVSKWTLGDNGTIYLT